MAQDINAKELAPKDLTPKKTITTPDQKQIVQDALKAEYEADQKMVRGKFIFHEVPGGSMGFMYKKYKWEEMKKYEMKDGETYTVPLGVAKHLNTNCAYPTYNFKNDEAGRPQMSLGEKIRRCSFQSLDFIDVK